MKHFSAIRLLVALIIITSISFTACNSPKPTVSIPTDTVVPSTPTVAQPPMLNSSLVVPNTPTAQQAQASQPTPVPAQPQVDQAPGNLLAMEWAGYDDPNYYKPFVDQHPNVKVDYSYVATDAESFAKAENNSDLDVIHPCVNYYRLFVEKGLVQPIDTSRIKNWSSIYPEFAKLGEVDGKQYFIPWDWGYEAILVRTDMVKNIPTSWADLWNNEYKGHLSIYDNGESAYQIAALALGFDPDNATPEQDAQIKQKLLDLKPNLVSYWSDPTEASNLMASGNLWVIASAWNESYFSLYSDKKTPVKYVMPKEKPIASSCGYGISSHTKNLDLVYDYINARIAPESLAKMTSDQGYGPSNKDAIPLIDPETVKIFNLDDPNIMNKIYLQRPITEAQRQHFTDLWTEIKAAP